MDKKPIKVTYQNAEISTTDVMGTPAIRINVSFSRKGDGGDHYEVIDVSTVFYDTELSIAEIERQAKEKAKDLLKEIAAEF